MPAGKLRGRRKLGHTFIRIHLVLESGEPSGDAFTDAVDAALAGLYGVIGSALNWDLVEFREENSIAIIRCRQSDEERIWAAAGFMTQLRGSPCRLHVLESSPSLLPASSSLGPGIAETDE